MTSKSVTPDEYSQKLKKHCDLKDDEVKIILSKYKQGFKKAHEALYANKKVKL